MTIRIFKILTSNFKLLQQYWPTILYGIPIISQSWTMFIKECILNSSAASSSSYCYIRNNIHIITMFVRNSYKAHTSTSDGKHLNKTTLKYPFIIILFDLIITIVRINWEFNTAENVLIWYFALIHSFMKWLLVLVPFSTQSLNSHVEVPMFTLN